jgi:hypothetical protein
MLQGLLLLPFLRKSKFSIFIILLLIALGGLNLQLILRTQKLFHQWISLNSTDTGQWRNFSFSTLEWNQKTDEEKKEFQVDDVWYDIKDVIYKNGNIVVVAKADKWENIFKDIITENERDDDSQNHLPQAHFKWKYVPNYAPTSANHYIPPLSKCWINHTSSKLLSKYLFFILKPPMTN